MAKKSIGHGTRVYYQGDGDSSRVLVGFSKSVTPPPKEKGEAEATGLADDIEQVLPGIEKATEFAFDQFYDPGDEEQEAIDELFDSEEWVQWWIVYPAGEERTFIGWVKTIAEDPVENETTMSRKVTVKRTSKITTPAPSPP